jgi:hypothetical protein
VILPDEPRLSCALPTLAAFATLAPARIVAVVSAVFANFFYMLPSQGFEVMEGG